MSWVSLILALISAASKIYNWRRDQKLLDAGEDRQIAKALAEQLRKTDYVKQALEDAHAMSDDELAKRLRELEPGETDSK